MEQDGAFFFLRKHGSNTGKSISGKNRNRTPTSSAGATSTSGVHSQVTEPIPEGTPKDVTDVLLLNYNKLLAIKEQERQQQRNSGDYDDSLALRMSKAIEIGLRDDLATNRISLDWHNRQEEQTYRTRPSARERAKLENLRAVINDLEREKEVWLNVMREGHSQLPAADYDVLRSQLEAKEEPDSSLLQEKIAHYRPQLEKLLQLLQQLHSQLRLAESISMAGADAAELQRSKVSAAMLRADRSSRDVINCLRAFTRIESEASE